MESTILGSVNAAVSKVLFFDVSFGIFNLVDKEVSVPLMVALLFFGAIFFTFYFGFINLRGFTHALRVVAGKYDREDDVGDISHFRALTSALSATVGLGNIAGVAIAIQRGGPGAIFWMVLAAVFGMTAKFSSCTLAQLYRQKNADGSISGGPMYYLDIGLKERGFGVLGKVLGVIFAIFAIAGCLGGGGMFQVNQTVEAFSSTFALGEDADWAIGILMCVMVGAVIFGGIKRIGAATSRIVPFMCGLYVLASLYIILANLGEIPQAFSLIFSMAFSDNAMFGGAVGVAVMGIQRAAFSNEAGLGSAAMAHAAAKTEEPVREGMVAMLGPCIDTIIICVMTALVVVMTGAWNDPQLAAQGALGVTITTHAFATVLPWFPYVLTICIGLFAYSTMISWCYYGERGWIYLFDHLGAGKGLKTVAVFRAIFVVAILVGAVNSLNDVLDFTDLMILSMAFPNILGSLLLVPKVKEHLVDYWGRYKAGAFR